MEHGAQAAKAFTNLIKQTAPADSQPGKKRSLVIGTAGPKNIPVILVSPKKPTTALNELSKMSQKLGKVTPVAVGQVVFEDNVVHVKALKNANETKVRTAFLDYYKGYKVNPPSIKVKLWQPDEWEAVEFDEEAEGADPSDEEAGPAADGEAAAHGHADKPSDLGALTNELRSLILRIPEAKGAGPAVLDQLKKLAGEAGAAIKRNDAAGATAILAQLRKLLDAVAKAAGAAGNTAPATPTAQQAGGKQPTGDDLLATFREAKEEVDAGLNKLQAALRETEDPDMLRIAELGLYGLTGERGLTVGLTRALLDLRSAAADAREPKLQAAREAATAYKTAVLAEGGIIDLVDKNPFNVTVGIRSKLVAALDAIANAA